MMKKLPILIFFILFNFNLILSQTTETENFDSCSIVIRNLIYQVRQLHLVFGMDLMMTPQDRVGQLKLDQLVLLLYWSSGAYNGNYYAYTETSGGAGGSTFILDSDVFTATSIYI